MSWSSVRRIATVLLVTAALPALAACSNVRPLYGDMAAAQNRYTFSYAAPATRLDQVLYTELRLKLGPHASGDGAIMVAVSTSISGLRALTKTAVVKPQATNEVVVSATVTVTGADGETIFTGRRTAGALYTTAGQVLADTAALTEAQERAARALADTVRLAILGALESSGNL